MKKGTKTSRPLVRCPSEVIGRWKGCDIILKSNNVTQDALDFENLVKDSEFLWARAVEAQVINDA